MTQGFHFTYTWAGRHAALRVWGRLAVEYDIWKDQPAARGPLRVNGLVNLPIEVLLTTLGYQLYIAYRSRLFCQLDCSGCDTVILCILAAFWNTRR